jgi:hypothetical protein
MTEDKAFNEAFEEEKEKQENSTTFKPTLLKDISEDLTRYEWLWENVIARGHGTILTAQYKSGKSTFIRCLMKAMYDEEEFLGYPTKRCNILVVSEESLTEWKIKSSDFGLDNDDVPIWICKPPFFGKASKKDWISFCLEDLPNFCTENKIDLVIVDTVSHFWPVIHENDSGETGDALGYFDKLKNINIAVLVVQQSNKSGGESTLTVRGSSEIGGWPDEIIVFSRRQGDNQKTRGRQVNLSGRLFERDESLMIKLGYDNTYSYEGTKYEVSKKARMEVLYNIFLNSNTPLTIKEIRDLWDDGLYGSKPGDDTLRKYLQDAIDEGKLRFVDHIITIKKKTPRYGLVGKVYVHQEPMTEEEKTNRENPSYGNVTAVRFDNNKTNRSDSTIKENVSVCSEEDPLPI